ncbi:MAG: L,D-transpeptidase family protein [Thermodesulfobacteriota bacterium]
MIMTAISNAVLASKPRALFLVFFLGLGLGLAAAHAKETPPGQPLTQVPDAIIDPGDGPDNYILVVDKVKQRLYLYHYHDKNYYLVRTLECSTGENLGDKTSAGDKKTPEGFYVFNKKSLEMELAPLYGIMAFPMDYPNFWDKRLGKEGHGIWMHGINKRLAPTDSNGCVELRNIDIMNLEHLIKLYETPIIVYHDVKYKSVDEISREAARIRSFVESWQKAWSGKDFQAYKAKYAKDFLSDDGKDYSAWLAHKEKLNHQYAKIRVDLANLKVFRHQGLIVILFDQYYKGDKHFTSDGVKRLYVREKSGQYEIAAEIWDPFPPKGKSKMLPASIRERVLAEAKAETMVASAQPSAGKPAAAAEAPAASPTPAPATSPAKPQPQSPPPETPARSETQTAAKPASSPPKASKSDVDHLRQVVDDWLTAWKKKDLKTYLTYYHPEFRFRGMDLENYKAYKAGLAKKAGSITIKVAQLEVQVQGPTAKVSFIQDYRSNQHRDLGLKTLIFAKDKKDWRIKEESWRDISAGAKP